MYTWNIMANYKIGLKNFLINFKQQNFTNMKEYRSHSRNHTQTENSP